MLNSCFLNEVIRNKSKIVSDTDLGPEDRWTAQQINGAHWRLATDETEAPDESWKQHYALWEFVGMDTTSSRKEGDLVDEGPTHGGCDYVLYCTFKYIYPSST